MADEDWKKRVGISINYNSESDGENENQKGVNKDEGTSPESDNSHSPFHNNSTESSYDAILHKYEQYGTTPPRTRMSRHMKDWKNRGKEQEKKENIVQSKITRRNTFDTMYLTEFQEVLEGDSDETKAQGDPEKRIGKRFRKMLRVSERDLKLDLSHSEAHSYSVDSAGERAESVPLGLQPAMKVESCNRFLSLTSKLVPYPGVRKCPPSCLKNARQDLFNTLRPFGGLEKLPDKWATRQLSHEEFRWQNELKDLIWLELQAWHASRSLHDQDQYLCKAREEVEGLLHDIMDYTFNYDVRKQQTQEANDCHSDHDHGSLCLSVYCQFCIEKQNEAIRDIERLTSRLEQAESLFQSSKAFANSYPLYKDEKFIARVKSMCLWLNMTKQHRLKMIILGRLFISRSHTSSKSNWPGPLDVDSGQGSSTGESADQESPLPDDTPKKKPDWKPSVRFDVGYPCSSPSDSSSSNNSTTVHDTNDVIDYSSALATISQQICPDQKHNRSPYRQYIEEVLKTKALRKAVRFLERLHRYTLVRSCVTLEKPKDEEDGEGEECMHEEELRRHGFWSQVMKEIGLPSYRSSFLFLAKISLNLINEYLDMRLEQQPEKPSDLSLRQLMRELKEGLRLAVLYRERYRSLVKRAFYDVEDISEVKDLNDCVDELDKSTKSILQMYVNYLQRWCLLVDQESYQKYMLDEEWIFAKQVGPYIPEGERMLGKRFCAISRTMLSTLGSNLLMRVDSLTECVHNSGDSCKDQVTKQSILTLCRELQCLFNDMRDRFIKAVTFARTLKKDMEFSQLNQKTCMLEHCLERLKTEALSLGTTIKSAMQNVEKAYSVTDSLDIDAMENEAVLATIRETLHQGYKFGFEYHKEVCRTVTGEMKPRVARGLIEFAQMWINFVKHRCERGRGLRPRWANQGLDYLTIVCDPDNTNFLTDDEFEDLKCRVEDCIQHIIGKNQPSTPDAPSSESFSQSRGNSPTPRPRFRLPRSPHDTNGRLQTPSRKSSIHMPSDSSVDSPSPQERKHVLLYVTPPSRMESVRAAICHLEKSIDEKLRSENLIGCVTVFHPQDRIHIRIRQVNFSWQRGIKIGQGSFGKVYTAVNNNTGELMAMKEIQLQPNDHRTIKRIAEELRIFEGIQHKNLVRYYGVEIHREEMLIFMEFCEEGTLETLVAATNSGLPEPLVRRYTLQLVQAASILHQSGIVHRDIKSANIFLTDEGNCLKLGDFGSAVKIKAHSTMPGELQGFVGTQAYMAPEVFTRMNTEGHGRAADIWSVGCVVVEMASGRRPWAELDSNYQIMFKVGMGETPTIPATLSEEGFDFLDRCLQHDPQQRAQAVELLYHTFLKVDGEEAQLSLLPSVLEDYDCLGKQEVPSE